MAHLVSTDSLSARARARIAAADPGILRFAAMQPGGIRAWAEAPLLDGHGRVVTDPEPVDYDVDDLAQL